MLCKAILKRFSKSFLLKWYVLPSLPKRDSQEIFIVPSKSIFVKRDSTSKLARSNAESSSITSLANSPYLANVPYWSSKIILNLMWERGTFLLMLFCKRVFITRDKLPKYGRIINNSFFSTVYALVVWKKNFIQKSSNAIGNHFDGKRIVS